MRWWAIPAALLGSVALADVLGRAMGWGALGRGPGTASQVALTFDDGPSCRTPELLAVLQDFGVKATFFVTEAACAASPSGLHLLRAAGQQLEAHGRWHTHALLLPPWREWQQVRWHPRHEGGPHAYRPPYGGHGPFTRLLACLNHRQIVLWDVEGRDWLNLPAANLAAHALAQVRPGSVILLHDGPAVTPELLKLILQGLQERGLRPVTLHELSPQRISWKAGVRRLTSSYGR